MYNFLCNRSSTGATQPSTAQAVNFTQLEENINKWTIELEEQEKVFMNQVAHINEWDRLLLTNGDKVIFEFKRKRSVK